MAEYLVKDKLTVLDVFGDVISIKIHCGDAYEAQTVFDELCEMFRSGQGVTIGAGCRVVKEPAGRV